MTINLTYGEFVKRAKQGNVIPVWKEFPADLETPVSIFLKIGTGKPNAFLLESVELGERLGRYSFIGTDPDIIIEHWEGQSKIRRCCNKHTEKENGPLLNTLEKLLNSYKLVNDRRLPVFTGGFVGYLGYELVQQFEDIKLRTKKGLSLPDAALFFSRNVIVFDHIKHELKIIHMAVVNKATGYRKAYRFALQQIKSVENKLRQPLSYSKISDPKENTAQKIKSNMTPKAFETMVDRAKEYIRAGDCIQVVLSQRFDLGFVKNDFSLYRALRSLNPSPYMFYFKNGNVSLVGSSPEMLTRKTGQIAETRPIAGTRPRGNDEKEDQEYENALKHSTKEMAEHLMLVDLGRNDLGRVCEQKSVRVENFARVERYSHVMHLVSDINGKLKRGKSAFDLLRSTFPAGTLSGAPKIRAMQIIDELEPEKRGPYGGCLGYFGLNQDMDMCITIRTIAIQNGHAFVQAGAGIVNDSKSKNEFKETQNKARALFQAVQKSKEIILS